MEAHTNKRSSERHMTMGLMSNVFDGKAAYLGVIEDISATGVCLSQVPAVFDDTTEQCFTVVKGPSSDFRVMLHPCWAKATNRGMYKVIGFRVEEPSKSWGKFVEQITAETGPFNASSSSTEVVM